MKSLVWGMYLVKSWLARACFSGLVFPGILKFKGKYCRRDPQRQVDRRGPRATKAESGVQRRKILEDIIIWG